jgi:hypothetical protein
LSNVLYDKVNDNYVLADFHLASSHPNEQNFDNEKDLYMLAVLMYRLLNEGRYPYESFSLTLDDYVNIERRLKNAPLPPPRFSSYKTSNLLMNACSLSQESRYSLDDFLKLLQDA